MEEQFNTNGQENEATGEVNNDTHTQMPELTINDLINCRTIIDVAVKRGTFSASEVAGVGGLYNKLDQFITATTPSENKDN